MMLRPAAMMRMGLLALSVAAFASAAAPPPAVADDLSVADLGGFRAEMARLSQEITTKRAELLALEEKLAAGRDELRQRREALDQAFARLQHIQRQRSSFARRIHPLQEDAAEYGAFLELEQERRFRALVDRKSDLEFALLHRMRFEESYERMASQLSRLLVQRARLRTHGEARFSPPILGEAILSVPDLREGSATILYHGRWEPEPAFVRLRDKNQALLHSFFETAELLPALENQLADAERALLEAEQEWERFNLDYPTLAWVEAIAESLLETAESRLPFPDDSLAAAGALVFEAGLGAFSAVSGRDAGELPSLADEIVRVRTDLAAARTAAALAEASQSSASLIGAAKIRDLFDPPADREGLGAAAAGIAEGFFEAVGDPLPGSVAEGERRFWPVLFAAWMQGEALGEGRRRHLLFRRLLAGHPQALDDLAEMLRRGRPDLGRNLLNRLRNQPVWQEAAEEAIARALATLERHTVADALHSERGKTFYAMALTEIDWFLRRSEYRAMRQMVTIHRLLLEALDERLARAIADRDAACCRRTLGYLEGAPAEGPIIVSDWQWDQVPELTLTFSAPLAAFEYRFARSQDYRQLRPTGTSVVVPLIRDLDLAEAAGPGLALDVRALSREGRLELDADPATAVLLDRDLGWSGYEPGPDLHHRMAFGSPTVAIDREDIGEMPGGVAFEVSYTAPRGLHSGGWIGIFPAGAPDGAAVSDSLAAESLSATGGETAAEGRIRLAAPLLAGEYEVRLYDRAEDGFVIASAPFAVRAGPAVPRAIQLLAGVPEQPSSRFKADLHRSLLIETASWDRVPYFVTPPQSHVVVLQPGERAFLAGDPSGRQPWGVDSFLLLEIEDQGQTRRFVLGRVEPVLFEGEPLPRLGPDSYTFGPDDVDLTPHFPTGRPVRLRVSALDHGNVGWVRDLYLIIRPK